jgi:hypothetical protein
MVIGTWLDGIKGSKDHGRKRANPQLQIASQELDLDGLSAVWRDWVISLLVQEFLAEHNHAANMTSADYQDQSFGLLGREGADTNRIP